MDINEFRKKRAERQSTYVKFREGDDVKYIRFLDECPANQARLKAFDSEAKKYLYDADIPNDSTTLKISIVLKLNVVTYEAGGKNPILGIWEFSEFLYNKFAKAYVEDPEVGKVPNNVWKVKVANPGTKDVSYAFIKINATEDSYPIPQREEEVEESTSYNPPPFMTDGAVAPAPIIPSVKKNKYFE
jgi:hypothetical protein